MKAVGGLLQGSSPLTLGKRCFDCELAPVVRLIPAYGGKTLGMRPRLRSASAHPRSRGENSTRERAAPHSAGSSPLMRGKHGHASQREVKDGLIPAHAGKTSATSGAGLPSAAHPRSREENGLIEFLGRDLAGSSPLTRGKRKVSRPTIHARGDSSLLTRGKRSGRPRIGVDRGLIPAHAGKTTGKNGHSHKYRAHPRSRGENAFCRATNGFR